MIRDYKVNGVVVMAIQVLAENVEQAALFCHGQSVVEYDALDVMKSYPGVNVPTLSGVKRASEGDYIVKELGGQVSVVRKHVFGRDYELA